MRQLNLSILTSRKDADEKLSELTQTGHFVSSPHKFNPKRKILIWKANIQH